jgi:hypothetical protein
MPFRSLSLSQLVKDAVEEEETRISPRPLVAPDRLAPSADQTVAVPTYDQHSLLSPWTFDAFAAFTSWTSGRGLPTAAGHGSSQSSRKISHVHTPSSARSLAPCAADLFMTVLRRRQRRHAICDIRIQQGP